MALLAVCGLVGRQTAPPYLARAYGVEGAVRPGEARIVPQLDEIVTNF